MILDFAPLYASRWDIAQGVGITILLALAAFAVSLVLGVAVGVARTGRGLLSSLLGVYVSFFRGTPLLIQLFLVYYGLPALGINLGRYPSAILTLGLNSAAYTSEILRGALLAVAQGQKEAAAMLGFTRVETFFNITFPQTLRVALPSLVNSFTQVLKETSLVSVLSIMELTRIGQLIYTRTYKPFEVYLLVAILYYLLVTAVVLMSKKLEKRVQF